MGRLKLIDEKIATQAFPLSEAGKVWGLDDKKGRIVFTNGL